MEQPSAVEGTSWQRSSSGKGNAETPPASRVLVVDDSVVARQALAGMLAAAGFQVEAVDSARDALSAVSRHEIASFDLILMDLQLPDGSGIDACTRIKQVQGWEDVPVIVVTSSDDDRDLTEAFKAGVTDYIAKPPRETELLARVRSALRLKHEMARRKAREQDLQRVNRCLSEQATELATTKEALVRLNQDLERRVCEQVEEITRRAREVDALNAQLRVQVQERSHELARALRRLSTNQERGQSIAPGETLAGRVRLVRRLANGGMGVIYAGVDLISGSMVAVKVLDARMRVRERDLQRFIAEASAAAAIDHPAIVKVRHVDVTADGDPFIVMELVDGVTLDALLADGPLSPEWTVSICRVVADALAAAHAADVIHRDIKPGNLMVCGQPPGVRVLDFGISKIRQVPDHITLTHTGILLGTPGYMAPEQFGDAAAVTPASDVYSLGAVMFQLVTGGLPFALDGFNARGCVDTSPTVAKRVPDVPEQLALAINRCLACDPRVRPSARELSNLLDRLQRGLDVPSAEVLVQLAARSRLNLPADGTS